MVTVSISETENTITNFLQKMFRRKHVSFGTSTKNSECDYIFVRAGSKKHCDITLIHAPSPAATPADYITIINTDEPLQNHNKSSIVVTYGLNSLATVTASSIRADSAGYTFSCCVQRSFVTLRGKLIEPQEFSVFVSEPDVDPSSVLGFVTLALVLSFSPTDCKQL